MSIPNLILLITFLQLVLYIWNDKVFKKSEFKRAILLFIILFNIFLFPRFYYAEAIAEIKCGLPILAVNICFIIIGNSIAVLTHFLYRLVYKYFIK